MTIHDDNIFLYDSRLIFLWFVVVVVVNVRMNNKQMSGRRQQNKQKSYRKIPSKISEFVTHTNSNWNFQWRAKKCLKNFFFVLCVWFFSISTHHCSGSLNYILNSNSSDYFQSQILFGRFPQSKSFHNLADWKFPKISSVLFFLYLSRFTLCIHFVKYSA